MIALENFKKMPNSALFESDYSYDLDYESAEDKTFTNELDAALVDREASNDEKLAQYVQFKTDIDMANSDYDVECAKGMCCADIDDDFIEDAEKFSDFMYDRNDSINKLSKDLELLGASDIALIDAGYGYRESYTESLHKNLASLRG